MCFINFLIKKNFSFKVVEGTPLTDGRRLKYRLNGNFFFFKTQTDDLIAQTFGCCTLKLSELIAPEQ